MLVQRIMGSVKHIGVLGSVLVIGQGAQRGFIGIQHLVKVLFVVDAVAAFSFIADSLSLSWGVITAAQRIGRAVSDAPFLFQDSVMMQFHKRSPPQFLDCKGNAQRRSGNRQNTSSYFQSISQRLTTF